MSDSTEYYYFSREELAVLLQAGGNRRMLCWPDVAAENEQAEAQAAVSLMAAGFLTAEEDGIQLTELAGKLLTPVFAPVAVLTLVSADQRYFSKIYYIRSDITLLERSSSGGCVMSTLDRAGFCRSVCEHPAMVYAEPDQNIQEVPVLPAAERRTEPAESLLEDNGIFLMECLNPEGERQSWLRGYYGKSCPMLEVCGRQQKQLPLTEENLNRLLRGLWRSEKQ